MMKLNVRLANYVADFVATKMGVSTVFTVTGGGAMYLNDAFGSHPDISYVAMHHEQTAAMAAEGYYRETGSIAVCQVTTGPGGTNAITGCAGAWIDSEAILFISGQVESYSMLKTRNRQTGVQEVDIISMVKSITKGCLTLADPLMIRYELERLVDLATTGRFGPVWIDIPLDLQNFKIPDTDLLLPFKRVPLDPRVGRVKDVRFAKTVNVIKSSKKPVILLGNGCRHNTSELRQFLKHANVPVVTGWNARDLALDMPNIHLGSAGIFGNRAANIAVQESDLVLGLGYRFSVPQTGYDPACYAPKATIVAVEIDVEEHTKLGGFIDHSLICSVSEFFDFFRSIEGEYFPSMHDGWTSWCQYLMDLKFDPPPLQEPIINSFDVNTSLSKSLSAGDTIVTDMGTSFTCTHQSLALVKGTKLFTSSGLAAMGFGLPGAIGSSHAKARASGTGRVVLISGDGGLMFNLQELQSVVTHRLNIKIIVYENDGYVTMKHMQAARFKKLVGSNKDTMLECADFVKISNALGIEAIEISRYSEVGSAFDWLFEDNLSPRLLVIHLDPEQPLVPRVQTRSDEFGHLMPPSIHDMFPHLDKDVELLIQEKLLELVGI